MLWEKSVILRWVPIFIYFFNVIWHTKCQDWSFQHRLYISMWVKLFYIWSPLYLISNILITNFFFFFFMCWVFVAAGGGYSSLRCEGFSLRWLLLLWSMGSRCTGFSSCGLWALEHRLSSCGAWAQLLHGVWDPPRLGLKPMSSVLTGGFPTTAPPRKSLITKF